MTYTEKNIDEAQLRKIYEQAYICGYNDAKSGKRNKYIKEEVNSAVSFGHVTVGNIIKFGSYPQSEKDRKESIEWRVLVVENGKALLISKYALDCKPYNIKWEDTTWEKCTLRKWLNSDFIKDAFIENEQNSILLSKVTADKNPRYSTNQGNDTEDKVFLLSVKEAEKYFKSYEKRKCKTTDIAVQNGAYVDEYNGHCWWWLRSLGDYSGSETHVMSDGSVDYDGNGVNDDSLAVRPALWINLKS